MKERDGIFSGKLNPQLSGETWVLAKVCTRKRPMQDCFLPVTCEDADHEQNKRRKKRSKKLRRENLVSCSPRKQNAWISSSFFGSVLWLGICISDF